MTSRRLPVLLLLLLLPLAPLVAQTFPALSGRVVDAAHIITPAAAARMEAQSAALEEAIGAQLVVVTVPDLQGHAIGDYGYRLGRHWGIGQKGADNGVLLLVAPTERQVRIEVGYGLEPVLTDALSSIFIRQQILPPFREGRMSDGIEAGFDAILHQLRLSPEAAEANVRAAAQTGGDEGGDLGAALVIVGFILLWMWLASRGGRGGPGGGGRRRGGVPIIFWPGGGFGGGFGGRGGGGFGGGGGGFGGGGASGGW